MLQRDIQDKEFHYTKNHFDAIRALVFEHTGISMADTKSELIYSRLSRRLRKLNLDSFDDYCDLIRRGENKEEIGHFVNSVTTNLTSFFREKHHFEFVTNEVIPKLLHTNQNTKKIRIWSAGCSTGKEPYSIAIAIKESVVNLSNWDVKILATDIDTDVLSKAKNGIYSMNEIDGLEEEHLSRWFKQKKVGNETKEIIAKDELKNMITFKPLNLMHEWPMKGPFDVIFCRNVVIYFNKQTQKTLFARIAQKMASGSNLILGHSESLLNVNDDFTLLGKTIYEKK